MSKANGSKSFLKTYGFLIFMISGIVAGCLVGAFAPTFGGKIKFLGTLFINMMFCVVVPMVFCSIASAIANMKSVKRAGKIMGVTIATFLVTAAIAGILMYIVCRIFPLVDGHYTITEGEIGDTLGFGDMIVNFFTKPDFMELLSRKAILPLIVAAVLFGFGVQMNGGPETKTAQLLEDITGCIMKTVKLITYYAPIAFFAIFADLVATYGAEVAKGYGRALLLYRLICRCGFRLCLGLFFRLPIRHCRFLRLCLYAFLRLLLLHRLRLRLLIYFALALCRGWLLLRPVVAYVEGKVALAGEDLSESLCPFFLHAFLFGALFFIYKLAFRPLYGLKGRPQIVLHSLYSLQKLLCLGFKFPCGIHCLVCHRYYPPVCYFCCEVLYVSSIIRAKPASVTAAIMRLSFPIALPRSSRYTQGMPALWHIPS